MSKEGGGKGVMRKSYPDDLSEQEWGLLSALVEGDKQDKRGRKPLHEKRELLNAIFIY